MHTKEAIEGLLIKEYLKHDKAVSDIIREFRDVYGVKLNQNSVRAILTRNKVKLRSKDKVNEILRAKRQESIYQWMRN